ncbi:DUF1642 domain-containing protein (plasmid) [Levilactobacillus brevis]|nr:DUF1642 domain-containing protein [Levilactobacillus brevis]
MKIYQKQPVEAEQFDGSQKYIFGQKVISDNSLVDALTHDPVYYSILINEDDSDDPKEDPNEVVFEIGDWIIKYGEDIHAIPDDMFKKTYAELPVIPKCVADWIEECKRNDQAIASAFDETLMSSKTRYYFCNYSTRSQWISIQDAFVRAWLDGYQVEAQHDTRTD